jgi:putative oxidoreductase
MALLVARLSLGIVILPHGMQKALECMVVMDLSDTRRFPKHGNAFIAGVLVILAEFVGLSA